MSLTQISLECGFCDQAHFCHLFTRSEGINPFAWRCQMVRGLESKRSQPSPAIF
jgi:transcriptional regulator GlxA family with amidase domain